MNSLWSNWISLSVSLSLFPFSSFFYSSSSFSSSTTTSWALARPSSSPGIPCQQFTRPHPVWSNKETRAISCLSYCQPPPSAHILTFPSFDVTKKRGTPGLDKGRGKLWQWPRFIGSVQLQLTQATFSTVRYSFCPVNIKREQSFWLLSWFI